MNQTNEHVHITTSLTSAYGQPAFRVRCSCGWTDVGMNRMAAERVAEKHILTRA